MVLWTSVALHNMRLETNVIDHAVEAHRWQSASNQTEARFSSFSTQAQVDGSSRTEILGNWILMPLPAAPGVQWKTPGPL